MPDFICKELAAVVILRCQKLKDDTCESDSRLEDIG